MIPFISFCVSRLPICDSGFDSGGFKVADEHGVLAGVNPDPIPPEQHAPWKLLELYNAVRSGYAKAQINFTKSGQHDNDFWKFCVVDWLKLGELDGVTDKDIFYLHGWIQIKGELADFTSTELPDGIGFGGYPTPGQTPSIASSERSTKQKRNSIPSDSREKSLTAALSGLAAAVTQPATDPRLLDAELRRTRAEADSKQLALLGALRTERGACNEVTDSLYIVILNEKITEIMNSLRTGSK